MPLSSLGQQDLNLIAIEHKRIKKNARTKVPRVLTKLIRC